MSWIARRVLSRFLYAFLSVDALLGVFIWCFGEVRWPDWSDLDILLHFLFASRVSIISQKHSLHWTRLGVVYKDEAGGVHLR